MENKLFKDILLEAKLDEVANIYDGLLMTLENTIHKIYIGEAAHYFTKKETKFNKVMASLEDQISCVNSFYHKLINLNEEISQLGHLNPCSISWTDENRDRAIKAFQILGDIIQLTNNNDEQINLCNLIEITRNAINFSFSIIRYNRLFQNDSAFQYINDTDIVSESSCKHFKQTDHHERATPNPCG
ncbi:MAG: hypothetical protein LBB81_03945 [Treponema sp.]|jgi:hypothetical protein|nr:hypothetical protein [Treponema sp.]